MRGGDVSTLLTDLGRWKCPMQVRGTGMFLGYTALLSGKVRTSVLGFLFVCFFPQLDSGLRSDLTEVS